MYSPNEIDPTKIKIPSAGPAGAPIGYSQNQSVGLMASNQHYLDTKVAMRKPIPRNMS